jgi:hypothetical protein
VILTLANGTTTQSTPTELTFAAPTLGLEMQLPTKASGAPSGGTFTYYQGDLILNSAPAAGGIAGWVNTATGAPGTWTPIPTGNPLSSGTMSGATTTASHTFSAAYSTTPNCRPVPESNVGSWYISTLSTSAITVTYATSGSSTWTVGCQGTDGAW